MHNNKIKKHIETLKKEVFFVDTKWPQFDLLFKDLIRLSKSKKISTIVSLERGSLYGNISLFAPLFDKKKFVSIDCSTDKILSRGSYNKKFVKNDKIIKIPLTYHFDYKNIKIEKNFADLIIIPNLMHHVFDYSKLLKQCKKILKKNGKLYIFEPTFREIHQSPDDYFRFTPFALKLVLKNSGFKNVKYCFAGGPFTAVYYCLDQAIQYVPKNKRKIFSKKFVNKFQDFRNLDKIYKKNLVRKNTIFPTSFSIEATV